MIKHKFCKTIVKTRCKAIYPTRTKLLLFTKELINTRIDEYVFSKKVRAFFRVHYERKILFKNAGIIATFENYNKWHHNTTPLSMVLNGAHFFSKKFFAFKESFE